MGACRPRLEAEIGLVAPKMIIVMGDSAWKAVTGRAETIGSVVNKEFEIEYSRWDGERMTAILIPTYHTAALLHSDGKDKEAMRQMKYAIGDTFTKVKDFIDKLIAAKVNKEAKEEVAA
jgi:uracil-DNA glycosylase family 4